MGKASSYRQFVQMTNSPIQFWQASLDDWGIPREILNQAPQSPWIHPPESFKPESDLKPNTPSWIRAKEALLNAGQKPTLLDVGCGGGRASFALVPPAAHITGVDHQQSMLELFVSEASSRSIAVSTIFGKWLEVAHQAPSCDVVVCHHVLFNVHELAEFTLQLTKHARHRVVVEIPMSHPLSNLSPAWKHFWNLQRPSSPTALDAAEVISELGININVETFTVPDHKTATTDRDVAHARVRLCLDESRDAEVREFLQNRDRSPRTLVTLWWETSN